MKCPEGKIQMLTPVEDKLLIQLEGQSWHVLALKGDQDYDEKLSRAIAAKNYGQTVELQFPKGYDNTCMSTDTSIVIKNIKLIKQ